MDILKPSKVTLSVFVSLTGLSGSDSVPLSTELFVLLSELLCVGLVLGALGVDSDPESPAHPVRINAPNSRISAVKVLLAFFIPIPPDNTIVFCIIIITYRLYYKWYSYSSRSAY